MLSLYLTGFHHYINDQSVFSCFIVGHYCVSRENIISIMYFLRNILQIYAVYHSTIVVFCTINIQWYKIWKRLFSTSWGQKGAPHKEWSGWCCCCFTRTPSIKKLFIFLIKAICCSVQFWNIKVFSTHTGWIPN